MGGTRTPMNRFRTRRDGGEPARTGAAVGAVLGALVLLGGWMVSGSIPRPEFEPRFADGAAWLTSTALGGISLHDGGDGAAMTNLQVAQPGDDFAIAQNGPNTILVNNTTGEIARVEAATWSVPQRIGIADPGEGLVLALGNDAGWIIRSGSVAPVDPSSLSLRAALPVGEQLAAAAVASDGSLLFSGEARDSEVYRFVAGEEPSVVEGLSGPVSFANLNSGVAGLDRDGGAVWLEGAGIVCDGLEVPPDTALVGSGTGSRFVAVAETGSVFVWAPADGCPTTEEFLAIAPGSFGAPVVADGWAVIPDVSSGEVIIIDLDEISVIGRRGVLEPGTDFDLVGEDDSIWFNDPTSEVAGLVKPNGEVIEIEKYSDDGIGDFAIAPTDDPDSALEVAGPGGGVSEDAVEGSPESGVDGSDEETDQDETPEDESDTTEPPAIEEDAAQLSEPDLGTETETTPPPPLDLPGDETAPDESTADDTGDLNDEGLPPAGPETEDTQPDEEEETDPAVIAVSIQQSKATAESGDSVVFRAVVTSGDPATLEWNISPDPGGAGASSGFEIERSFDQPGRYSIQLTACDGDGATCDSATVTLQVVSSEEAIPVAVNISAPSEVLVGEPVDLLAVVEGDPDSITWTIEDGSPSTASGASASTSFGTVGVKTVTVTAERGEERVTDTRDITVVAEVEPTPLVVRCSPRTPAQGDAVQCSIDGYSTAVFADVDWSFSSPNNADGSLSPAGGTATLTYDGAGTVTVTASASDVATGEAVSDSDSVAYSEVAVEAAPIPTISGPTAAEVDQTITFTVDIDGGPADTISWSAEGTGATGSGSSFSATWQASGSYAVTVQATGPGGTETDTHTIAIGDGSGPTDCNEDATLEQPTVTANDVGGGRVDVTVSINKCATADINWRTGRIDSDGSMARSHTFVITGLDDGEVYTFSTTVIDGLGSRRFGSASLTIGVPDPGDGGGDPTEIIISNLRATPSSPTSVEISASTNICAWSDWAGTAVSRTGPRDNCFTAHSHKNPDWRGSLPLSPGGTYTVTFTAHDPDGVLPSVSATISFTMPTNDTPDPDDPDGDGVLTSAGDNCPNDANVDQGDNDGDGIGNVCDPDWSGNPADDPDGDGVFTSAGDNCPDVSNADQSDADGDGVGDVCDPTPDGDGPDPDDPDGDGVFTSAGDNCPDVSNGDQADADGDGIGDVCDPTPNGDPPPPDDG